MSANDLVTNSTVQTATLKDIDAATTVKNAVFDLCAIIRGEVKATEETIYDPIFRAPENISISNLPMQCKFNGPEPQDGQQAGSVPNGINPSDASSLLWKVFGIAVVAKHLKNDEYGVINLAKPIDLDVTSSPYFSKMDQVLFATAFYFFGPESTEFDCGIKNGNLGTLDLRTGDEFGLYVACTTNTTNITNPGASVSGVTAVHYVILCHWDRVTPSVPIASYPSLALGSAKSGGARRL